jgi:hypothetical protein
MKIMDMKPELGTYVWLTPTSGTVEGLRAWAGVQGFESLIDFTKLHVTVLYSRSYLPVIPDKTWFYPATASGFKQLDKSMFVMTLDSPGIVQRHEKLMSIGATHDWATFIPHMSLWKGPPPPQLEPPGFTMIFTNEQCEPLKP